MRGKDKVLLRLLAKWAVALIEIAANRSLFSNANTAKLCRIIKSEIGKLELCSIENLLTKI